MGGELRVNREVAAMAGELGAWGGGGHGE